MSNRNDLPTMDDETLRAVASLRSHTTAMIASPAAQFAEDMSDGGVKLIAAFGSRISGEHQPQSDLDVMVVVEPHLYSDSFAEYLEAELVDPVRADSGVRAEIHLHTWEWRGISLDPGFLRLIASACVEVYGSFRSLYGPEEGTLLTSPMSASERAQLYARNLMRQARFEMQLWNGQEAQNRLNSPRIREALAFAALLAIEAGWIARQQRWREEPVAGYRALMTASAHEADERLVDVLLATNPSSEQLLAAEAPIATLLLQVETEIGTA